MTPTGWPPTGDRWAWRVLVAISDQLHAYHHALTLLADLAEHHRDAARGSLARPLAAAAGAAVTTHDHPWLYDLLHRHDHAHTAQRWQEVTSQGPLDAIRRLRRLAWLDEEHVLDPNAIPPAVDFATTAFHQAGQQLADLEADLLATLGSTCSRHAPTPATTSRR
jgi:hypothetical protein